MKKHTLFILFIVLTMVFVSLMTTVAFASTAETSVENTEQAPAKTNGLSKNELINLIVVYCVFGISLVVGIPALRAVNKRKKQGYVDVLVKEVEEVSKKIKALYYDRNNSNSKKNNLKYSLKIVGIADMALTTYTEKQISGYYDLFNDLNDLKIRLSDVENIQDEDKRDEEYGALIAKADVLVENAKTLAHNESIIKRYNK